jgi:transposase
MTTEKRLGRVAMSQRERDVLRVMQGVIEGKRTQSEAARLLKRSVRHVRRLQRRLQAEGDASLVHGLRGRPSNRQRDAGFRRQVLKAYRRNYRDFGPTLACEQLAKEGLTVGVETLRRWLLAEGLWQRRRQRDPHRSRRPRRSCFGELVQMDASIHEWLEGRGASMVLIAMIDDATSRIAAKFYGSGTVEAHMDLLGEWLRRYGRPGALYTDRHSIFELQDKGRARPDGMTQFGRALSELDVELIRAHSPQAKGRVERLFGTAQDRWVKEMRLANVRTIEQANALLERLVTEYNRRFTQEAQSPNDAHRRLGPSHRLDSILSIQSERVVSNDYTIRFENRIYQLRKPAYSGERGGRVVIEQKLDGTMSIRFRGHYLQFHEVKATPNRGGTATPSSGSNARPTRAAEEGNEKSATESRSTANGKKPEAANRPKRPAKNHPWRKSYK